MLLAKSRRGWLARLPRLSRWRLLEGSLRRRRKELLQEVLHKGHRGRWNGLPWRRLLKGFSLWRHRLLLGRTELLQDLFR